MNHARQEWTLNAAGTGQRLSLCKGHRTMRLDLLNRTITAAALVALAITLEVG